MSSSVNPSLHLEPNSAKPRTGFLLIHGLTGMPSEMKPLTKHLQKQGYRVEVPILAGHGASHKELLATTWQDWLAGLQAALDTMAAECDDIFIVGLSVGALLAILLAANNPNGVSGITLLSIDMALPGSHITPLHHLMPVAIRIPFLHPRTYWTETEPYGLRDKRLQKMITRSIEAAKNRETDQFGLFRTYLGSLYQTHMLIDQVMKQACHVVCPVMVLHSLEDTMLRPANATKIYGLLGSAQKSLVLINGCDHVMTVDLRKNEVCRLTQQFAETVLETQCQTSLKSEVA